MPGGSQRVSHRCTGAITTYATGAPIRPVLYGHNATTRAMPKGEHEPGCPLALGIQERHPKSLCRKGFRRQHDRGGSALAPPAFGREIGQVSDPRLAYAALPALIWTSGPDGSCDYLNERWTEYTGHPAGDMLGWKWLELVHPEDRKRMEAEYGTAVAATASGAARVPAALPRRRLPLGPRRRRTVPRREGDLPRLQRLHHRHHRPACAGAASRGAGPHRRDRPARRRHRARLQQPADRHPRPRHPAARREQPFARRRARTWRRSATPRTAPPRSPATSSPSAAGRSSRPARST